MAKRKNKDMYKHYVVPSAIGGGIAFLFSSSLTMGIVVFLAVWFGNWIGHEYLKNK